MEKGKWYKLSSGTTNLQDEWYVEFPENSDQGAISLRYININTDKSTSIAKDGGNFRYLESYKYTEVPKSEIQEFLPIEERDQVNNNYQIF